MTGVQTCALPISRQSVGPIGWSGPPRPWAGSTVAVAIGGRFGVPEEGVGGVVLNVTATGGSAPGYFTVFPCGYPQPPTSNLNVLRAGQTVPVAVAVGLGVSGKVCIYSQSETDLVVDLATWFPAHPNPPPQT